MYGELARSPALDAYSPEESASPAAPTSPSPAPEPQPEPAQTKSRAGSDATRERAGRRMATTRLQRAGLRRGSRRGARWIALACRNYARAPLRRRRPTAALGRSARSPAAQGEPDERGKGVILRPSPR